MAEREIIAAAEELLRERPFRDLTVDEVMRRTELSRPSFYVYFRDRHHLVLRVVERLGAEMWAMSERWFEGRGRGRAGSPRGARGRRRGVGPARARDARAGGRLDGGPATSRPRDAALMQSFIDVIAKHIESEIAAGRILPLDAKETARALSLMNDALPARRARADADRDARDGGRDALDDLDRGRSTARI